METNLRTIAGNWDAGFVLDKHTRSSVYIGDDANGHPQFDTKRLEVGEALFQLKYRDDFTKAEPLAGEIATQLIPRFGPIGFIVPMPATNERTRQPVTEIARALSTRLNVPMFDNILVKLPAPAGQPQLKDLVGKEAIQSALLQLGAENVTVYCSGNNPRNNIGGWPVEKVHSTQTPGSRAFFVAKDTKMANAANYGLMIWDAKSTGTLSNVIELLNHERSSRVFVNKKHKFITVSDADGLKQLAEIMSEGARAKAEDKINLSARIAAIKHKQLQLSL
jgi:hypothetical protein